MLSISRHDSVTVLHFSGGKEEALRLAKAIEAMPEGSLVVPVPDPRGGETRSVMRSRMADAASRAEVQFGKKERPMRGKIFDCEADPTPVVPSGPTVAPDPDAGAEEEQAEFARLQAAKAAVTPVVEDPTPEEPPAPVGEGEIGAGVTVS